MELSEKLKLQRELNQLCARAMQHQPDVGNQRQRRRHLKKHLLRHIPAMYRFTPKQFLHTAMMLLITWGFGGFAVPAVVEAASPVFKHHMLNGFDVGYLATPSFVDIDGDGDLDAFVGERRGKIKFYQNNGTNLAPDFVPANGTIVVNPLAAVNVGLNSEPAFADIDGDGDLDAFVGTYGGMIKFYQNNGTRTAPTFVPANGTTVINPLAGVIVGKAAVPKFVDIDGDGDLDMFAGELNGVIKFYQNNGTNKAPNFVPANGTTVINPLARVMVGRLASPSFADIDGDGDLDVFVGETGGTVRFYQNNGTKNVPNFVPANGTTVVNPLAAFNVGFNAAPAFADLDGDGDLDAFVGENFGTIKYYQNNGTPLVASFSPDPSNPLSTVDVGSNAAPVLVDIDGDGDLDAFIGNSQGALKYYRNDGTNKVPNFVPANGTTVINPLAAVVVGYYAVPAFVDIDGDGDLDVFIGEQYGAVKYYQNNGTNTAPNFVPANGTTIINPLAGVAMYSHAAPSFADIDNDGDLDVFVGSYYGVVSFYQNNGTNTAPNFVPANGTTVINPLALVYGLGGYMKPVLVDIDGDGDLDAFIGDKRGIFAYYRNNGTKNTPNFVAANGTTVINPLAGFDIGKYAVPAFVDIDGDGDFDTFVGNGMGKVAFFENAQPHVPSAPTSTRTFSPSSKQIRITWKDISINETGFHVYRRVNKGTFSLFRTLPANTIAFTDRTVKGNRNYSYKVTAFNMIGESAASNVSTVRVLAKPKALRAKVVNGKVRLVWQDKAKGERKYLVQRKTGKGPYRTIRRLRANSKTFTDRRVRKGMTYRYRVKATGTRSSSSWSNQRVVRP